MRHSIVALLALIFWAGVAAAQPQWRIETIVSGLNTPWAVAALPEGGAVITERDGRLLLARDGTLREISGAPEVVARGQGGLLDVTLARDFAQSRRLFLTYAKHQRGGGSGTALARAELPLNATRLRNLTEIFAMKPGSSGGRHFGSRVVVARDGTLFLTIGDRGDRPSAQDLNLHSGSVLRLTQDGAAPADNPFVGQPGILPEIWSFGHRNPQGAGLDARGGLWTSEHGARGGDEVNRIRKGANYGWPVISYGRHYSGQKIGEGTAKDGMEQPQYYWDPSIAPSGLLVYTGRMFPGWQGDIFVGSLKFDHISQLSGTPLREVARIKTPQTQRIRDLAQAPDGAIWFLSEGRGTLYRLTR